MKKIVKPHKARKPSASTDVPSFARGKDQILKSSTRLQKRKRNELGEFDDGKNLEFREVPKWQYVDDGSGNLGIVDTNTGQTGTFALPELTVSTPRPIYAPKPWQYFSTFDGSLDNTLNTLDAMTGGTIGMAPALGDALDGLNVVNDVNKGDYTNAGIGLGLLALPNFIEKPLRGIKKGVKWIGDEAWLLRHLRDNISGLTNPYLWERIKKLSKNPTAVRNFSKYVDGGYNADLPIIENTLPQLEQLYKDFPGLGRIPSSTGIKFNSDQFLADAREMANRAKHYAGGYEKLMNRLKSENTTLYSIAKESPQYAQQIYGDLINGRIGNTEDYVKSLIDQSNTFMRGMRGINPKTNPDAYLTIGGGAGRDNTYTMDVGSPNVVLDERMRYGTPVIYKPKNRQLTGSVDTWWSQRTPQFSDKSISINPIGMHTGDGVFNINQLIPNGKTSNFTFDLGRMLMPYLKQLNVPQQYRRNATHMVFKSPNKGASIADQFDIIPASDVDLNTIKFGLGYRKGKDDHRYYDYIIAQSMLGNPTAKRMTGEDDRYISAFGPGDRSNLVIGSYGNYATPSVMNVGGELMYIPNPWEVLPGWMVHNQSFKFNNPNDAIDFAENYKYSSPAFPEFFGVDNSINYDKGKDSGKHIKKANRGKFTAAAKRAGMGVQAYARKILNAPKGKYSSTLRKRANFAANAAKWHK